MNFLRILGFAASSNYLEQSSLLNTSSAVALYSGIKCNIGNINEANDKPSSVLNLYFSVITL
jgi:hypothetical protein